MQTISFILLIILLGQTGGAPTPIHTDYDKYWHWTEIKTNWLYVLNSPDQFLQLKLIARFDGKQMPRTGPTALQIEVISHAPKHKYVTPPELIAIADGVELRIGKMDEHPNQALMGMFKGGREGGQSMVNEVSPVPASAAILAQHKIGDLAAEWIVANINWEDLTTLAKARKIDWRLNETEFSFIEVQATRLRQFVAAVTPESGVVVLPKRPSEERVSDKLTHTDTPSDANNSNLKETLSWLKKQITKYHAGTDLTGETESLALTSFDTCNIQYEVGITRLTLFYSVNLKDLEPGAVDVTRAGDKLLLRFSTRDRKQLIKLDYRDKRTGERLYSDSRPLDSTTFSLNKNDLGPEMKEALSHAIKLCQVQP
jgi:hypothetical protein